MDALKDNKQMKDKPKHPGGRPTKYKPEYCQQIIEFFSSPLTKIIKQTRITKNGSQIIQEIESPEKIPTKERFAHIIDVNTDTLIEWTKEWPEFSEAYIRAGELQRDFLVQNTLPGRYDSRFAQFFAQNCCGMKQESSVKIDGLEDALKAISERKAKG